MHNTYRRDVQPPAATALTALTWDANLATVSYNWAAKCTQNSQGFLDHNPNRSAEYGQTVGENIYAGSAASINTPYLASKNWNDENTTYTLSTNSCTGVCGHYTQIVTIDSLSLTKARFGPVLQKLGALKPLAVPSQHSNTTLFAIM